MLNFQKSIPFFHFVFCAILFIFYYITYQMFQMNTQKSCAILNLAYKSLRLLTIPCLMTHKGYSVQFCGPGGLQVRPVMFSLGPPIDLKPRDSSSVSGEWMELGCCHFSLPLWPKDIFLDCLWSPLIYLQKFWHLAFFISLIIRISLNFREQSQKPRDQVASWTHFFKD